MLKLALIENLRRLADEMMEARDARRAADAYVGRIEAAGEGKPPPLPAALHPAFVLQLLQRMREYGPRLSEESARVDGLAALVEVAEAELEEALRDATRSVESLEARGAAPGRVISASSRSVVFVQGAYGFTEPTSGKPLRFLLGPDGRPVSTPGGTPVTVEGDGPVVEILYTGTAFVATGEGYLLTNRHVAIPWEFEPSAQETIQQGFQPVMRRMIGYLPELEQPFEVELVAASVAADVALLRCQIAKALPPLELAETAPRPGDEVIVLGYPSGMRALVARAGASVAKELLTQGAVDFWALARGLSRRGLIVPLSPPRVSLVR